MNNKHHRSPPDKPCPATDLPPPAAFGPPLKLDNLPRWGDETPPTETPKTPLHKQAGAQLLVFVLGTVIVISFLHWLVSANTTVVRVLDMEWQRTVTIEQLNTYTNTGWVDEAPRGVINMERCDQRYSHSEECNPHDCRCHEESYDCHCSSRRGRSSCSTCTRRECSTCYDRCPVYRDWCTYQYQRWDTVSRNVLRAHDNSPAWPNVSAGQNQRVSREESYTVTWVDTRDPNRVWDHRPTTGLLFPMYDVNQRWNLRWSHSGLFDLRGRAP